MIKRYLEFLLEKVNHSVFISNFEKIESFVGVDQFSPELKLEKSYMERMRKDFASKINGLSEYFESYFSNLASSNGDDPVDDFNEMQKIIDKTGFTLDVIKKLFSKKVCQLTSEYYPYFIHQNRLDIINGYIDVYLYMIDEKLEISKMTGVTHKVDLGGQGFDKDMDPEEWIIKYAYGYHKTPYGQLFIKELGLTPEQFIEMTFMNVKDFFSVKMIENLGYQLNMLKRLSKIKIDSSADLESEFDWTKYVEVDDDGFIIYYSDIEKDIIEKVGDLSGTITEEFIKKLVMECFDGIKDVIKIHDSGDYFHFHE